MTFTPEGFRQLPVNFQSETRFGRMSLILIKNSGHAKCATTKEEKDNLLHQFEPEKDLLIMNWTGMHQTDVYVLTKEDIKRFS